MNKKGSFFSQISQIFYDIKEFPLLIWILVFTDAFMVTKTNNEKQRKRNKWKITEKKKKRKNERKKKKKKG